MDWEIRCDCVPLTDLVGIHILTAVSMDPPALVKMFAPDANVLNFELDGVAYTAVEDPDDGYRSMMGALIYDTTPLRPGFQPFQVFCYTESATRKEDSADILTMRDVITGKIVLQIGTDRDDSYYPMFVARWIPENMAVNQERRES